MNNAIKPHAPAAPNANKDLQRNKSSNKAELKGSAALKSLLEPADIEEDLMKSDATTSQSTTSTHRTSNVKVMPSITNRADQTSTSGAAIAQSSTLFHQLIDKELAKAATQLGIHVLELKAWVDLQIEVPAKCILALLRTMQSFHLDPLNEELGFVQYEDGHWQLVITIEGCAKLLNAHSQFNGLVFHQADTLIDGVPEWIECSIYRKDRLVPTSVREYLTEVRGENPIWKKMPRRMLRHRALQQCVRLAMA